jgi:hypothetical protein
MTDVDRLVAAALAARRFNLSLGPRVRMDLQEPTHHELQLLAVRSKGRGGEEDLLIWTRRLVLQSIVGWIGVRQSDLLAAEPFDLEPDPPVDFDPRLIEPLLDANVGWTEQVRDALLARVHAWRARVEAAAKN